MTQQSLAKLAGMLCGNPRFQAHIGVTNAQDAAAAVRRQCGVASRRELDEKPEAARKFHELRRAFVYSREAVC